MLKGRKIRNLIEKDNVVVSLEDVILKATELTVPFSDLEYNNKKTTLTDAKKKLRELKSIVNALDKRVRIEVYEEVMDAKLKNKHKHTGDVERFKKNN